MLKDKSFVRQLASEKLTPSLGAPLSELHRLVTLKKLTQAEAEGHRVQFLFLLGALDREAPALLTAGGDAIISGGAAVAYRRDVRAHVTHNDFPREIELIIGTIQVLYPDSYVDEFIKALQGKKASESRKPLTLNQSVSLSELSQADQILLAKLDGEHPGTARNCRVTYLRLAGAMKRCAPAMLGIPPSQRLDRTNLEPALADLKSDYSEPHWVRALRAFKATFDRLLPDGDHGWILDELKKISREKLEKDIKAGARVSNQRKHLLGQGTPSVPYTSLSSEDRTVLERFLHKPSGPRASGKNAARRPLTIESLKSVYCMFDAALAARQPELKKRPINERFTREAIDLFLAHCHATTSALTKATYLDRLKVLANGLAPAGDHKWINRKRSIIIRGAKKKPKQALPVTRSQILQAAYRVLDDFRPRLASPVPLTRRDASTLRNALIVLLVTLCPARRANLASIRYGEDLVLTEGVFRIYIDGNETKTGRPQTFSVPKRLTPFIKLYVDRGRRAIFANPRPEVFWIGLAGESLHDHTIACHFEKFIRDRLGVSLKSIKSGTLQRPPRRPPEVPGWVTQRQRSDTAARARLKSTTISRNPRSVMTLQTIP